MKLTDKQIAKWAKASVFRQRPTFNTKAIGGEGRMGFFGRGGGRKKSIFRSVSKSMGMGPSKRKKPQKGKMPKIVTKALNKQKLPNV